MTEPKDREWLIKWLDDLDIEAVEADETLDGSILWDEKYGRGQDKQDIISDFILSREKQLLEKIGQPLKDMKDVNDRFELAWGTCLEHKAIDEALAIIEKEGNE